MENINRFRILQVAQELFKTRGYRSVTIKELADKLGMSKKTIYQYFSSKEEIATVVVEESMDRLDQIAKSTEQSQTNPLVIIKEILKQVKDEYIMFGPLFLIDIEKYLPDLANRYTEFRRGKKKNIEQFLKIAQEMGIMKDFPIPLAMDILSSSLKAIVNSDSLSQHRFSTLDRLDLFLEIFCNGIASSSNDKSDVPHST